MTIKYPKPWRKNVRLGFYERVEQDGLYVNGDGIENDYYIEGWRAAIAEVKRLNK